MMLLLLDGLNLVRRVHAAVPVPQDAALHCDAVLESCVKSVRRALEVSAPTHAVCVFDAEGPSWRHGVLASYKATRPPMPAALSRLLPRIETAIRELGVRPVRVAGFEADDVIASIAKKVAARDGEVLILSTDKSMLSLLGRGVRVRNHFEDRELDAAYVRERFGVAPCELPVYLALIGDRSIGIPGVASVGPKTARRLIAAHGTLEGILAAAAGLAGRLGVALRDGASDARLSLELTKLRTDVEVGLNLKACRVNAVSRQVEV